MSVSDPLPFRVYSDTDGKVYLLYEPQNWHVEVETPVTEQTLEAARLELGKRGKEQLKNQFLAIEGDSEENATPQQRANRQIKAILEPAPPGFLKFLSRLVESFFEGLFSIWLILAATVGVYKAVQFSQERLPEKLHLLVLFVCAVLLALSIYLVAVQKSEFLDNKRFVYWFGEKGLLFLSFVNLVGAASVFASITLSLYNHQRLTLEPCAERPVDAASLLDFYMWHLLKLIPLLKLNETLKWGEPLCYKQGRVGALILLFQGLVVLPCINAIRFYWKNRQIAKAKPYKYIYEPGWRPESN
ncbi:MAG TPA: hypothetical protein VN844_04830 [Pyrinomonadaceae bacterium]|nr:hypothetical protein [Pyrinomonadaceae bacterium]